jgi:protein-S-isoprenylcysteine O-methyltransferase Ste14
MEFKIIALGLMAIFYTCYFLKMINQKKQGIHTDQLGKGKDGLLKVIEISLKITTYLLPIIQIVCILFYSENLHLILRVAGLVIELFGIVVFIASVVEMKDNWRAGVQKEDKTKLVTTGIYTISRNPAFLGFDLMYIGILLTFFNWYLLFATIVAIVLFHLQIVKVEENFLIEAFGQEYLNYQRIVCRYFGNKFWIK